MSQENKNELNAVQRFIAVFSSPAKTGESIKEKPTFLVPFLIIVLVSMALNFYVLDIIQKDQIAVMEAKGMPAERIEIAEQQMQGPLKYISMIFIPIGTLVVWLLISFFIWLSSNIVLGGKASFKQYYSLVAWTWLIQLLGGILKTALIKMNGTAIGVSTSLAMFMETPELGQSGSLLYQILAKFDFFIIWQMATWVIGISILNQFSNNKSTGLVVSLYILWTALAIALSSIFGGMMMG